MDKLRFRHSTQVRVRNFEVDWQGIVHNANYLLYCEIGRIEYLRHVGVKVDMESIMGEAKIVVVRNEINYRSPAMYDEILSVYTRLAYIRHTSFAFEGYIEESVSGRPVAENLSIHVWLDQRTGRPKPVTPDFRDLIGKFEGENLTMIIPPAFARATGKLAI